MIQKEWSKSVHSKEKRVSLFFFQFKAVKHCNYFLWVIERNFNIYFLIRFKKLEFTIWVTRFLKNLFLIMILGLACTYIKYSSSSFLPMFATQYTCRKTLFPVLKKSIQLVINFLVTISSVFLRCKGGAQNFSFNALFHVNMIIKSSSKPS